MLSQMGNRARQAASQLALSGANLRNRALGLIAQALRDRQDQVLQANAEDMLAAVDLSPSMRDRLLLTEKRLDDVAEAVLAIRSQPDPLHRTLYEDTRPNGLHIRRVSAPLGVIAVIYEARPNVTIDIATLCLKTGNAAILRGGSETLHSNVALTEVIQAVLASAGLPAAAVQAITDPDRALVAGLLQLDKYVDMIIPRGGAALHRLCREQTTIPVITGGMGICHIFVDESADLAKAIDIVENAKVQRPSVCNALDTVLVHQAVAALFLPAMAERLAASHVELRATPDALSILRGSGTRATLTAAGPDDFDTEWLALILGVKIVDSLDEAICHIQEHSTEHSDSILTGDWHHAQRFVNEINSAAVFVNASTRFNDGGQFGLGAEVAISTQKLHARGPMGLEELTTYKWIAIGDGHVRE